ncbi:hypothetical protein K1719_015113 [Acacia pycnantha]|nr:hypothetical protein K1719_015113 [Acacia pycnantha]
MQKDYDCLLFDEFTLVSIVGCCASLASLYWLRQVHGIAVINGLELNVILNNALIDAYGKCGLPGQHLEFYILLNARERCCAWTSMIVAYTRASRLEEACRIFNEMPMKNTVSWTAFITGFAQNGRFEEALDLFEQMLKEGVWPSAPTDCGDMKSAENLFKTTPLRDIISWNTLITGFAQNGRGLDNEGLELKDMMEKHKCGDMKSAENLFKTTPLRDIISWNTLITGFAQNGRGLDNEGLELKDMMEKQYGVKARLDHYAILIDLLGRKNRLEEALDLIESHVGSTIGRPLFPDEDDNF